MKNISIKQYKAIDLILWAVILLIFESLTTAAARWFPWELYTLSQTLVVVCIVMMRWGGCAAIHAIAGGFAFCLMTGARPEQFAVYCLGNCLSLIALFLFRVFGKEAVRTKTHVTALFVAAAFTGAQLGRWLVSLFFGGDAGSVVLFFTTDSLTLVYTVIVVLVARKADGIFEDQRSYLIRTEAERRAEESDL